ncbi:TlpA family protein disulfide reductase [Neolewinella xylanilytica]|uniref:TlpA family protein disulfide reductase n=1 Tax=Neolewinella xylanilytica TaxID=1514080 RepID=UPI000CEB1BD5|nr:TlpA disulfide reductase family protein [Neolewinella xylanilytica]
MIGAAGQAFRVTALDDCGGSITLLPVDTTYGQDGLRTGGLLSELDQPMLLSDSADFRQFVPNKAFLLLDFWGSWCRPCVEAIPELREFYARNADRVQLIGMNRGDTQSKIAELRAAHGMSWPSYRVTEAQAQYLGVSGYPTLMLFSRQGELLLSTSRLDEVIQRIAK